MSTPEPVADPCPPRRRSRLARALIWGLVTVVAILAGALGFAYTYVTDSATLCALINTQLPQFLPGSRLEAAKVQIRPFLGEADLKHLTLHQPLDGRPFPVLRTPWVHVRCDVAKLWEGKLEPREIIVAQPTLRLSRRADGSWNVVGLLADPWPGTPELRPTVRITKGSIELVEGQDAAVVLHNAELTFEPTEDQGIFHFAGSAQGDAFERLVVEGTLDTVGGRVCLERSDLTGLTVSDALRHRLPAEWQEAWDAVGLTGGEFDVAVDHARCGRDGQGMSYSLRVDLRGGTWERPELPFPLSDVAASARIEDGRLSVISLDGRYGKTHVRVDRATLDATRPVDGPMEIEASVTELVLDGALKRRLPPDWQTLWDDFAPDGRDEIGRISLAVHARRRGFGEPFEFGVAVRLLGVAMTYRLFPFPLEQVRGEIAWAGREVTVRHLETQVNGRPLTATGKILDPGPRATVDLAFEAGAISIDEAGPFVAALPPDIRGLVTQFHPTGSVRGTATLHREPKPEDPADELGDVKVSADLLLNEGCSIRWDGLPYPVQRLTGKLAVRPDHCTFTEMRGENGEARITASGRVDALGPGLYAADVALNAQRLRFDNTLRNALPPEWQATWRLLDPSGYCSLESKVVSGYAAIRPDRPDRTWLRVTVAEDDDARVQLRITPAPGTPGIGPGRQIELPPMQDVRGEFLFDNGLVTMSGISFSFREAPTRFLSGQVKLEPSGRFTLGVRDLEVQKLRLDPELRQIMPPLMGDFAAKLDDGHPFAAKGDLTIGWSGDANEPAFCEWEHVKVFFQNNSVAAGLPLEHIQGQLSDVRGRSDGKSLEVAGVVELDSFVVAGQQFTAFGSPLVVTDGVASLTDVRAELLGGVVRGAVSVTLDDTPEYRAGFTVDGAELARYTQTIPGRQDVSGKIGGRIELQGQGADLRRLNGGGEAHLTEGRVGTLPAVLRILSPLNLGRDSKAAFDSADVRFTIQDGEAWLDPIKITGNTISLQGAGKLDTQGEIDLELKTLLYRDERLHVPGLSDATREAGGQLFKLRVRGYLTAPQVKLEPLPGVTQGASAVLRRLGDRRRDGSARPPRR